MHMRQHVARIRSKDVAGEGYRPGACRNFFGVRDAQGVIECTRENPGS